jgi:hypothetical protein
MTIRMGTAMGFRQAVGRYRCASSNSCQASNSINDRRAAAEESEKGVISGMRNADCLALWWKISALQTPTLLVETVVARQEVIRASDPTRRSDHGRTVAARLRPR